MGLAVKHKEPRGSVIVRSSGNSLGTQRVDVYRELDSGAITVDEAHEKLALLERQGHTGLQKLLHRAFVRNLS